jgi:putative acetyltransferase
MKSISIRPAQLSDLSQLTIIQVCAIEQLSKSWYTPKQIRILIADKSRSRDFFDESIWIAIANEHLVAFATLAKDTPWINGLFVHPDFARQKIGTKLIQTIEKEAIKLNWRCLWVYASLNSQSFYQSQGYQFLTKDIFYLEGEKLPVILMKKDISPQTNIESFSFKKTI